MAQSTRLIQTLKKTLKSYGLTYADVAQHLNLSEASIKRLFSETNISLARLDQICELMNMEISDLVRQMREQSENRISGLSKAQEREIASDIGLLLVTVCVLNHWSLKDIVEHFTLTKPQCIQYLATLDRLKLIELLPKNKIKLLISAHFKWRENGAIQHFFQKNVLADFFNSRFDKRHEQFIVLNGMLSEKSNQVFQYKIDKLALDFDELTNQDVRLPLAEKKGYSAVLAIRPWRFGIFEQFVRD